MTMTNAEKRSQWLQILAGLSEKTITRKEIYTLSNKAKLGIPYWWMKSPGTRIGRGVWKVSAELPVSTESTEDVESPALTRTAANIVRTAPMVDAASMNNFIPTKYENFVPFGNFDDLKEIIASKQFYPVFITGHSGNGKTFSVEQACAQLKRKFVCVSITSETDEGDLLGNYVLMDNTMIWKDGPVTIAAKEGAILCLDEIDYGAANLTTLQRVLEGKPFLLKKKNELVTPAPGFNVIATANTKGRGSDDGRYMFTNVLNEAFLERFPIMFEQEWAPKTTEVRIIRKELLSVGQTDDDFATLLVDWAGIIRKTFLDGGCQDVISTRRLVHITKAYAIFKDRIKAIQYCLNRFEQETKISFLDLYTKLDASVTPVANTASTDTINTEQVTTEPVAAATV